MLKGRWTITAVNGMIVQGMWLELARRCAIGRAETRRRFQHRATGLRTGAYFGCNSFFSNGWTRNGDKLTLGPGGRQNAAVMSRSCDRGQGDAFFACP
jgi:hypothetical protein